jgi:hypothetical protein
MITSQFLFVHVCGATFLSLFHCFKNCALANEVLNFIRVMLVKHWIDDGAEMHPRTYRERELAKSRC